MDFNRIKGLKKDFDFRKVYKYGKFFVNKYLVIYIFKNKLDYSRVGIFVLKKVGKVIIRNRVRRLIKEVYRLNIDEKIKFGYDIVFIVRVFSKDVIFKDIDKFIKNLVKRMDIFI